MIFFKEKYCYKNVIVFYSLIIFLVFIDLFFYECNIEIICFLWEKGLRIGIENVLLVGFMIFSFGLWVFWFYGVKFLIFLILIGRNFGSMVCGFEILILELD